MKRIVVLILLFGYVFIMSAFGDEGGQTLSLFYQANASYSEEDFENAISEYEEALALGLESGEIYYNLGNAYFKNGSLGKAIANYLRAARLMPRDADLKSNLSYAQSLIKGGLVRQKRNWLIRLFYSFSDSFSLDEITLLSSFAYFALAIVVILIIILKDTRRPLAYACGLLTLLLALFLSAFLVQYDRVVAQKEAVVIVERADSRFEPFADATTFFSLQEGERVAVVKSQDEWVKVKRADSKQGWIKLSHLELL